MHHRRGFRERFRTQFDQLPLCHSCGHRNAVCSPTVYQRRLATLTYIPERLHLLINQPSHPTIAFRQPSDIMRNQRHPQSPIPYVDIRVMIVVIGILCNPIHELNRIGKSRKLQMPYDRARVGIQLPIRQSSQ